MSRLEDINGKESSKRMWASRFLSLGFFMVIFFMIIWGVLVVFTDKKIALPDKLMEMWIWLMGFGTSILLGTIFEKPKV